MVVSIICYFHPYLGKISNLTCAYFSDGWFNHQPVVFGAVWKAARLAGHDFEYNSCEALGAADAELLLSYLTAFGDTDMRRVSCPTEDRLI